MLVFKPTYDNEEISKVIKKSIENLVVDKLVQIALNEVQKQDTIDENQGGKNDE